MVGRDYIKTFSTGLVSGVESAPGERTMQRRFFARGRDGCVTSSE